MTLKDKLQELMSIRGLKQNVLAKKAGISQSLVSEILNGKRTNVSLETLQKISAALNIHVMYFIEQDTIGPGEILTHLTEEEKKFVMDRHSAPWIKMSSDAAKEGITAEQLSNIVKTIVEVKRTML